MRLLNLISVAVALSCAVYCQTTRFCDPLTSICYSSYTNTYGIAFRVAIPEASQAPFDLILQIVAPIDHKWVGHSFRGRMQYSPLAVGWTNGNSVVSSSRWATAYSQPQPYTGAVYTPLKGTGSNSTSWTLTARCQGCSTWTIADGSTVNLDPNGAASFAWAQSFQPVTDPKSNTSTFTVHDSHGTWTHDLSLARSSQFDTWVANNLLSTGPTSTSLSTTLKTTSSSRTSTSTTSTISTTSIISTTSAITSTTSSITTTSKVITTTTSPPVGGTIAKYGQCGGIGWTGSGTCVTGTTCKYSNDWYSQCL